MKRIKAWHFCADRDGQPVLRDGQPLTVRAYHWSGRLEMCASGLHASRRLIDALKYAPGPWLSRVECWGDVESRSDKLVCRHRRVLWIEDATRALHRSACDIAEHALLRSGDDDPRSWEAIKCKRRWLLGTASDSELAAAWTAAWTEAWDAAWDAARTAAWDAARTAAWTEAWTAAWDAARTAAWTEWNDILLANVEAARREPATARKEK